VGKNWLLYVTWIVQCVILGCVVEKYRFHILCDGACLSLW